MNDKTSTDQPDIDELANQLREAIGDLNFRLRRARRIPGVGGAGLSILSRLYRGGPQSQTQLAAADGVQPQSLTRPLDALEAAGYLAKMPNPSDGRKLLISLTPNGFELLREDAAARSQWLADALTTQTTTAERVLLAEAITVLFKVAAGDIPDAGPPGLS